MTSGGILMLNVSHTVYVVRCYCSLVLVTYDVQAQFTHHDGSYCLRSERQEVFRIWKETVSDIVTGDPEWIPYRNDCRRASEIYWVSLV